MDASYVSLRRYSIVICVTMTCRARNVMHFAAQAQRFMRSAWMGVCSERVEIIPNVWCGANFVEAHMR